MVLPVVGVLVFRVVVCYGSGPGAQVDSLVLFLYCVEHSLTGTLSAPQEFQESFPVKLTGSEHAIWLPIQLSVVGLIVELHP